MKLDTKKDTPFSFDAFDTEDLPNVIGGLALDACHYHDTGYDLIAACAIRLARKARATLRAKGCQHEHD